jgi:hypothetical protein
MLCPLCKSTCSTAPSYSYCKGVEDNEIHYSYTPVLERFRFGKFLVQIRLGAIKVVRPIEHDCPDWFDRESVLRSNESTFEDFILRDRQKDFWWQNRRIT